jgi:hypothetical protein
MTDSTVSHGPMSADDRARLRALLQAPEGPRANWWATLAASALAAVAAVLMAGAVILGPGFELDRPAGISAER